MQNTYIGDIGDYAKYSLLQALSAGYTLGVSWYLVPDEDTPDGRHTAYLDQPAHWRAPDAATFDLLRQIVQTGNRSVSAIEASGMLPHTIFWNRQLDFQGCGPSEQAQWRRDWFEESLECLKGCDLVFADPDNGLKRQETFRPGWRRHAKSIAEGEARALAAAGRPVVIYHHNARYPRDQGGHDGEVREWQERLGDRTCAVRWRHLSARTFFLLNCTPALAERVRSWCDQWASPQVSFVPAPRKKRATSSRPRKRN